MKDTATQPPLLAVDLRPRPRPFNERLALANMRARVAELCSELTLMFLSDPSLEPERVEMVTEVAALQVQISELQGDE